MNLVHSIMSTWEPKCVEGGCFALQEPIPLSGLTHKSGVR